MGTSANGIAVALQAAQRGCAPRLPARAVGGPAPKPPHSKIFRLHLWPRSPSTLGHSNGHVWPPPRPARGTLIFHPVLLLPSTVLWRGIFAAQRASASAWLQAPSPSPCRALPPNPPRVRGGPGADARRGRPLRARERARVCAWRARAVYYGRRSVRGQPVLTSRVLAAPRGVWPLGRGASKRATPLRASAARTVLRSRLTVQAAKAL